MCYNPSMTREDHLLTILAEECNEVGQRCHKALRFGIHETQPEENGGKPGCGTNAERIMQEYADLCGVMGMLTQDRSLTMPANFLDMVEAKRKRVEHYLEYSRTKGRLEEK
jgi:hypothetical protein